VTSIPSKMLFEFDAREVSATRGNELHHPPRKKVDLREMEKQLVLPGQRIMIVTSIDSLSSDMYFI
jgi:hypothetical protein